MLVDGRAIAAELHERLAHAVGGLSQPPQLAIVIVGDDPVIESFVRIKKKIAEKLGISVIERRFDASVLASELLDAVKKLSEERTVDGIIIQLPLPSPIETQAILDAVPLKKDVDMLATHSVAAFRRGDAPVLPPVVGAIEEILERNAVAVTGKDVLIIGHGRLVGAPAELFFRHNDAHVTVIGREVERLSELTKEADIIISGAGQPGLLKPEMLKHGVVLIDAGTSESGGKIVGDAEPSCAEVASIFTPVPGGVGPIAVALIFKNLLLLAKASRILK
ncbi:MAG: hypothetical protein A2942_01550 [Candidatus Lloydbacteria bacterium RIFCSPLOWO2_01_FULL_50_20]|uniref:Bifunctional protein FolD n=1 Tax=Candidatus Lloydbacteria bacterium RIFCSPLOWO2_01_FULL_50_20 TaxID=1798665 RepID=A0A1G2DJL0_9BACT|nr:MAG: hypothetical protein A3C13_03470 [Candidatus Lloydbacteria bacterium RIFCSPHIGHO2_02_FULL_50_11]OGZ13121.1 MAG: hypothetical protein A2942_01550 [Candidatus Lloydbacteria bacterium RIFCSPLOWO2_01_FULL_50_20]